jgi:hypothetical protein
MPYQSTSSKLIGILNPNYTLILTNILSNPDYSDISFKDLALLEIPIIPLDCSYFILDPIFFARPHIIASVISLYLIMQTILLVLTKHALVLFNHNRGMLI